MKLNSKVIILIVIAILISWVGNIYIFNKYSLEKPLMLNSYSGSMLTENYGFELRYISNIYDQDNFISASLPEISNQAFPVDFLSESNIKYSSYRINVIYINLGFVLLDNGKRLIDSDKIKNPIKKIHLRTNSGKMYEYDLGEILIFKEQEIKDNPIKEDSSMSSNNNLGNSIFTTSSDIKLTEIMSPLEDIITEVCDIKINGIPLDHVKLPLYFKAGDQIEVKYQFKNSADMKQQFRFSSFLIPLTLKGLDSKGNIATMKVHIYCNTQNEINAKDIKKLIKDGR
jgi:hypothetical protein